MNKQLKREQKNRAESNNKGYSSRIKGHTNLKLYMRLLKQEEILGGARRSHKVRPFKSCRRFQLNKTNKLFK